MKKLFAMMLAAAMMMSLASCGSKEEPAPEQPAETPSTEQPAETPDAEEPASFTVTEGKLTVATSPDFAPYEFYAIAEDGTPSLAGFDIALAGYIADHMGLELEIVPMDFDGVLMELATKKVDLGLAGLSPDPEREDAMDFSDIYYEGGQSFVTVTANKDKFTSLEDANKADISVGAQIASIQMDLAEQYSADADIVPLVKVTDIIAELLTGKLDGAYIETAVAESYKVNYPELEIVLEVPYDVAGSAVGVQEGNTQLMEAVNAAIADAIADGSMANFVAEAGEQASGTTGILVDGEIVIDG